MRFAIEENVAPELEIEQVPDAIGGVFNAAAMPGDQIAREVEAELLRD
jgi:hypothetical protein